MHRTRTIGFRLLAISTLGTMTACDPPCGWKDVDTFQLGIPVELHAVVAIDSLDDEGLWHDHDYLAVGPAGTVVKLEYPFEAIGAAPLVDVFTVGAVDLHGVVNLESNWWVVGDGGMAAVSADFGQSWTQVDVAGGTANLRAIADAGVGLVVVGDGVVLAQGPDRTWKETPPPEGGWGDLYGVFWDREQVYAIGRAGVVWSTVDPLGSWVAQDVGVDVDLNAIGEVASWPSYYPGDGMFAVVGANGTYLTHAWEGGWTTHASGTTEDLMAYSHGRIASADGTIFAAESGGSLTTVGSIPGTRALAFSEYYRELMMVGEDGTATHVAYYDCLSN